MNLINLSTKLRYSKIPIVDTVIQYKNYTCLFSLQKNILKMISCHPPLDENYGQHNLHQLGWPKHSSMPPAFNCKHLNSAKTTDSYLGVILRSYVYIFKCI